MILVNNIEEGIIRIVWETSLRSYGGVAIYHEKDSPLKVSDGDKINIVFGEPGSLERVTSYTVFRALKDFRNQIIAHEFAKDWNKRTQKLWKGPKAAAITNIISSLGEPVGKIEVVGGDKQYAQNESNIALLYRLSGTKTIWRNEDGIVNASDIGHVSIKEDELIEIKPALTQQRKYKASGLTPKGELFEVEVGEGVETRVQEVFHSEAEARDYLQVIYKAEPKARMMCIGKPGLRAGTKVTLPDGTNWTITDCKQEVHNNAWIVTAYLK